MNQRTINADSTTYQYL